MAGKPDVILQLILKSQDSRSLDENHSNSKKGHQYTKKRKTEKSSFINNLELLSAVPCGLQTFHVYPQRHIRTLSMD